MAPGFTEDTSSFPRSVLSFLTLSPENLKLTTCKSTQCRMVRLSMTQSMVSAIQYCSRNTVEDWPLEHFEGEPSLQDPKQGRPISHGQVIALSQCLRKHFESRSGQSSRIQPELLTHDLDGLLRGSRVYIEPPKPKPEPVSLMLETLSSDTDRRIDSRIQSFDGKIEGGRGGPSIQANDESHYPARDVQPTLSYFVWCQFISYQFFKRD